MYVVVFVAALLLGFVAGMVTLRRSERWCPVCGEVLRCVVCPGNPTALSARLAPVDEPPTGQADV